MTYPVITFKVALSGLQATLKILTPGHALPRVPKSFYDVSQVFKCLRTSRTHVVQALQRLAYRGRTDSKDTQERTSAQGLETSVIAIGQVLFDYSLRNHHSDDIWDLDGLLIAKRYGSFSEWQILYNVGTCYELDEMSYLRGGNVCLLAALTGCTGVPLP